VEQVHNCISRHEHCVRRKSKKFNLPSPIKITTYIRVKVTTLSLSFSPKMWTISPLPFTPSIFIFFPFCSCKNPLSSLLSGSVDRLPPASLFLFLSGSNSPPEKKKNKNKNPSKAQKKLVYFSVFNFA
jgi:hypothetical protein